MIVVAVIAILAAIAIPSYLGIQKKAARAEAKSNLMALSLALEGVMAENNHYGSPAGLYTHYAPGMVLDTFAGYRPSGLARIANLGNNNNYEYQVRVRTSLPPAFTIMAIPRRGRVLGDMTPWITQDGQRGGTGFGW